MDVLRTAIDAAKKNNIPTIVVASTTGNTALKLFELVNTVRNISMGYSENMISNGVKTEKLRMIVVTHDEGRSLIERRFDDNIRNKLLSHNITVYTHNPRLILLRKIISKILGRFGFPCWHKHLKEIRLKYGTGIKVCHIIVQMLIEGKVIRDDKVVAIAGTKSGADSVGIFLVKPKNKWPILQEVI